jgi:uncharacterized damage-inducible protein DinB
LPTKSSPSYSEDFAIATRDLTVTRFEREVRTTQKVIAALPDSQRDWKPDASARSAGDLAWHICFRDVWFLESIGHLHIDLERHRSDRRPDTFVAMAAWYGENMAGAMQQVTALTGPQLLTPLVFFGHSQAAFLYLLLTYNHSVHHRGQLSTYIRPAGGRVPCIYGSSADTPFTGV